MYEPLSVDYDTPVEIEDEPTVEDAPTEPTDEDREIDRAVDERMAAFEQLSEADYREWLHPRGRGGEWIRELGAQHAPDVEPEPPRKIADDVLGLHEREAHSHLLRAGYHHVSVTGNEYSYRSHWAGADIHLAEKWSDNATRVAATRVEPHPQLPVGDPAAALVGHGDPQAVKDVMRDAGYGRPAVINEGGDDWMEFVHPDGRGRALRVDDTTSGVRIGKVTAFTPTGKELFSARQEEIQADPFAYAQPGENPDTVVNALHTMNSGWRMTMSKNRDELSPGSLPEGVEGVTRFEKDVGPGQPPDSLVLHQRRGGNANDPEHNRPLEIVNAGHGSMVWDHMIMTPEGRDTEVQAWQQAQDDARRAREQRLQEDEAIKAALTGHDEPALLKALQDKDLSTAYVRLVQLGGTHIGTVKYGTHDIVEVRMPNRDTVTLTGDDKRVTKAEIVPQDRTRLPYGQAPKDLTELLTDVLGRADELGAKYKTDVNVKALDTEDVPRGAAGIHRWNGTIGIKERYLNDANDFLTTRAEGKQVSDNERLNFYNDLQIIQHEINHGVGVNGGINGLDYKGMGVNVEEALTEETGHLEVADWLRSYGMDDVLAAVKRHPTDYRVRGTYPKYRAQVGAIMNGAGLTEEERRAKLREMKFQMDTARQHKELIALAKTRRKGVKTIRGALIERGADLQTNDLFEPIVRPDLSDIDVEMPTVTTSTGRKVKAGDEVEFNRTKTLWRPGGRVRGTVEDVREHFALVKLADGERLWVGASALDAPPKPVETS